MNTSQVNIGIIGIGQIGKSHLSNYQKVPGARVVAIADINEQEAQRVAQEHGIATTYSDYHELLRRDDIQAVDVCLHNTLHRPATVAALEAGKHVYCEKPMASTYRDAKAMYDASVSTRRMLSIQLHTFFSSETRVARALIDEGRLGTPYHARSTGFRRRGRPFVDGYGTASFVQKKVAAGGALYDMGVYHIARMLYLLGNPEVKRVSGKTYQKTAIDPEREKVSGYDVEELGMGFVRFAGDVTMDIIEAWAIHLDSFEGSYLVGTEGGIRLEPFGFFSNVSDLEVNSTVNLERARYRWSNVRGEGDAYQSAQHHWVAALQGRVALLPAAECALNTMLISEGIYLSCRLDREVTVDEILESSG